MPTSAAFRDIPEAAVTRVRLPLLLIGAAVALLFAWGRSWPPAITAADLDQPRFGLAVPAPQAGERLVQTFTPAHDGLSALEFTLVHFREGEADPAAGARLRLEDSDGRILVERFLQSGSMDHNQKIQLTFPPEPASRGRTYILSLIGSDGNPLSWWGYPLDVLPGGALSGATAGSARELQFKTTYTFQWRTAGPILRALIDRLGPVLLAALFFIPLPGLVALRAAAVRWPLPVRWGAAWAFGIALWPLLWLWPGLLGARWSGWGLWLVLGGGCLYLIWPRRGRRSTGTGDFGRVETLALAGFLILVLAVRLLAVRDAAVLPWVDASRHALITAVMGESGRLLESYAPFLPVARTPYHYGAHTLTAGLQLLLGRLAPPEASLLAVMQLLSTALSLTLYAGAWLLTRRRAAGWLAAFLTGLPFFFPAYYTTWGRLTQLAGLLILPVLLALTWRLGRLVRARGRSVVVAAAGVAVLGAGLFLVHARVFLFYLPFALLVGLGSWLRPPFKKGWPRLPMTWPAAGLLLGLLVLPRLWVLYRDRPEVFQPALQAGEDGYNIFPAGYVTTGWERAFWAAAAVALALLLLGLIRRWPPARLIRPPIALALWAGLLFLLVGGDNIRPGWPILLPEVNLNSLYITLFVPQALVLAAGAVLALERLARRSWLVHALALTALGGWLALAALFGIRSQVAVLNETTLLVRPADLPALTWLAGHTPPEARVAHSAWAWLRSTWAGSDGGSWITPLTGRRSTTPPVDHLYSPPLTAEINAFNTAASAVADWSTSEAARLLRDHGVTHVFVGVRGGYFDPAALAQNPALRLRYAVDGVFIFELQPE